MSEKKEELEWKFVQSFGDDNSSDDDLVTAVEFDETGEFLAVGDKAGRICIFECHQPQPHQRSNDLRPRKFQPLEYKFYTEFQSHEPEFDCLKSLEIEEKINMIKWAKKQGNGLFLLATNDKTVKLWKVHEKKLKRPTNSPISSSTPNGVYIPKLSHYQTITTATRKKVFGNAHQYHINSISINSDGETFISADDLRINLWNLNVANESFNIVDVKPPNLEELTEVITSAAFHPFQCNVLVYSSSRGSIKLGDLRGSALCDSHSKLFEIEEDPSTKSFFSEIISSISDAKFTPDGRFIISRDYLTVKLWDVNMESRPVCVVPIHDYLRVHLCDLYENDCIFDKFECAASRDGNRFITGSYNNNFIIYNGEDKTCVTTEALKDPPKPKPVVTTPPKVVSPSGNSSGKAAAKPKPPLKKPSKEDMKDSQSNSKGSVGLSSGSDEPESEDAPNVNLMDFGKKALHVAWHPYQNAVAVAGLNKLYLYQA